MSQTALSPRVLVAGATTVEFYPQGSDRQPLPSTGTLTTGGVGGNVARGLAILDDPPYLATCLGNDYFGDLIAAQLDTLSIPQPLVTRTDAQTPLLCYIPDAAGGPDWDARIADSCFGFHLPESIARSITQVTFVHLSATALPSHASPAHARRAVQFARRHDLRFSFDINCRPSQWPALTQYTDTVREIATDADIIFASTTDLTAAGYSPSVDGLSALLPDTITGTAFLTAGEAGAKAVQLTTGTRCAVQSHPGFHVPVEDPVGGGDAFASGVLAGLSNGLTDHQTLLQIGNAAGAAAVSSVGPLHRNDRSLITEHVDMPIRQ